MKWCFLANDAPYLMEFLGKLAHQAMKEGDECLLLFNSKTAEYGKRQFFPKEAAFISKVDWSKHHYTPQFKDFDTVSWKQFFSTFDRYRTRFSYQKAFDIFSQLYQFTDFVFKHEKPDVVISELPSGIHNELVFQFCERKNIPYLGITDSLFDTLALYDRGWTDSRFAKTFAKLQKSALPKEVRAFIQRWLKDYLAHKRVPGYTKAIRVSFNQFSLPLHYARQVKEGGGILLRYLRERAKFKDFDFESEAVLRHSLEAPFEMEKRQFRIWSQQRFYRTLNEKDEFFLFPLQYQPEASTSVMAPYFSNLLFTIQNVAFSIPFPFKLYVKEHPSAVGKKPDSFYKSLQKIPNVVLIHHKENAAKLIQKCQGVIALTSTMGLEAALAGKPSYIFGNAFFAYHPFCRRVNDFEELAMSIASDLEHTPDQKNLKDINERFAASYYTNTIPGDIGQASSPTDSNNYAKILGVLRKRAKALSVPRV